MIKQRTISNVIRANGIGLHSGQEIQLQFIPASIDTGIVFRRTDLSPIIDIPANALLVNDAIMSTNLSKYGVKVGTIEHLMSAIAGLGIDNLIIELNGSEVPIMDGSAKVYIELLKGAGISKQNAPKKFIQIIKPIKIVDQDKYILLEPHFGFELNFEINFDHHAFHKDQQSTSVEFSTENFVNEISAARTFGFVSDFEILKKKNLALGASLDNAIGIADDGILNEGGLRFKNEFVRHKILDAIGDLYLLGGQLIGKFKGYKSGHALNNQLMRFIADNPSYYKIVTFSEKENSPFKYS